MFQCEDGCEKGMLFVASGSKSERWMVWNIKFSQHDLTAMPAFSSSLSPEDLQNFVARKEDAPRTIEPLVEKPH